MKKYIYLYVIFLFLSGCGNKVDSNDFVKEEYSVYEYHQYDTMFEHTEEFVVKYDKDGNFKELEVTMLYDKRTDPRYCPSDAFNEEEYVDLTYPSVKATCKVDDNGQRFTYYMNDESVKAGYLQDASKDYRLTLQYVYEYVDTEAKAVEYFEELLESMRDENVIEDDRNYIIIKGVRTSW